MTIGIIGFGMVGKAVAHGFSNINHVICDPLYNTITVEDVCKHNPIAIFVCVPTPTDDSNYKTLRDVLGRIRDTGYNNLVIVKSTVFPKYIEEFDVQYNPEFLSRATSFNDFVNPPLLLIGGTNAKEVYELYQKYSTVKTENVFLTDNKTAAMVKYTMNSFYATKVTFMNAMYDVAQEIGVDWNSMIPIMQAQPWMGTYHFQVPGTDGHRGFGGPCLPKDTAALVKEYDVELLKTVLELNTQYRNGDFE